MPSGWFSTTDVGHGCCVPPGNHDATICTMVCRSRASALYISVSSPVTCQPFSLDHKQIPTCCRCCRPPGRRSSRPVALAAPAMMRPVTGTSWRTCSGSAAMCMPVVRGPWCALTASRLAGTAPSLAGTACPAQRARPSAQSGGSASCVLRSCTARAPLPARKQSVAAQGSSSVEELGRGRLVGTTGTACGDAKGAAVEALNPRRRGDEARFQEVLAAVEGACWLKLCYLAANLIADV